jgi:hypothetical protein
MKQFNEIRAEWKELEEEDKNVFRHFVIFFIPIASIIIWLCATNTPPVLDVKVENSQLPKQTYELKGDWSKYAQRAYNDKYGK